MGAYNGRIAWETLRSISSTTFVGTYLALGTALSNPSYKLKIVNNSTVDVLISVDGVNAIDICPAGGYFLYDETQYINGVGLSPSLQKGTQFYVNGTAGTGSVYLVTQYLAVTP